MDLIIGINPTVAKVSLPVTQPENGTWIQGLEGVMFSYAEVGDSPIIYERIWKNGIRSTYNIDPSVKLFLDNGSFTYSQKVSANLPYETWRRQMEKSYLRSLKSYDIWRNQMDPDWAPMPRDVIPWVDMSRDMLVYCMNNTVQNNIDWLDSDFDYAKILHTGPCFEEYVSRFKEVEGLRNPPFIGLGYIKGKIFTISDLTNFGIRLRRHFPESHLHIFGVGGSRPMVHVSTWLQMDSIDSIGWHVMSARYGRVQSPNPNKGFVNIAHHLNERQEKPSKEDMEELEACPCPICTDPALGMKALQSAGIPASRARSGHNLWHLLNEKKLVEEHMAAGTYDEWCSERTPKLYKTIQQALESTQSEQLTLF